MSLLEWKRLAIDNGNMQNSADNGTFICDSDLINSDYRLGRHDAIHSSGKFICCDSDINKLKNKTSWTLFRA